MSLAYRCDVCNVLFNKHIDVENMKDIQQLFSNIDEECYAPGIDLKLYSSSDGFLGTTSLDLCATCSNKLYRFFETNGESID